MIPLIFAIFADMDSAAVAALTVAAECPRQYECGGVIYEDSGHEYRVSAPLTSHKHFGLEILQYTNLFRTAGGSWPTTTPTSARSTIGCSQISSRPLTRM